MEIKKVVKSLAGKEDITRGIGSEIQTRASKKIEITKLNATHLEGVITVDTIEDLLALDLTKLEENPKVYVLGYHSPNDGGGGFYIYNVNKPKSEHNGGTIIDASKSFPIDWNNIEQQNNWFNGDNTGFGVWERIINNTINIRCFGAKQDNTTDDTLAINSFNNNIAPEYISANVNLSNVDNNNILTKLKNVDGSGSGLDADKLDGLESSQFVRNDIDNSVKAKLIFDGDTQFKIDLNNGPTDKKSEIHFNSYTNKDSDYAFIRYDDDNDDYAIWGDESDENGALVLGVQNDGLHNTSDIIALESPAGVFLNTPNIYKGNKDNYSDIWSSDLAPHDFSESGYQKLPNGLIIQWGIANTVTDSDNSSVSGTINYPLAFPNVGLQVMAVPVNAPNDNWAAIIVRITAVNTDGFDYILDTTDSDYHIDNNVQLRFIAVGY
jgi:hypothetical protein